MIKHFKAQLAINARDQIGEGPAWDAAQNRLLWTDNEEGILHEARSDGAGGWRETKHLKLNSAPDAPIPRFGAVIPRSRGGSIVASGTEVYRLADDGAVTPFVCLNEDPTRVRFN